MMQRISMRTIRQCPIAAAHCTPLDPASGLSGSVLFYPASCGSLVVAEFFNLPEPEHFYALHIHEGTDCGGTDFSDSKGHLHSQGQLHSDHIGDLPVILAGHGYAWAANYTARFTPQMVLGRTVILHHQPDDFRSQPSGNSGSKLACGVIQRL